MVLLAKVFFFLARLMYFYFLKGVRSSFEDSANKLIIFTRTCKQLVECIHLNEMNPSPLQRNLLGNVLPKTEFLSLTDIRSSSEADKILAKFVENESKQLLIIMADLKEVTSSQLNYLKRTINEEMVTSNKKMVVMKYVVIIAHFPAELLLFGSFWDAVFLNSWEATYCDGVGLLPGVESAHLSVLCIHISFAMRQKFFFFGGVNIYAIITAEEDPCS